VADNKLNTTDMQVADNKLNTTDKNVIDDVESIIDLKDTTIQTAAIVVKLNIEPEVTNKNSQQAWTKVSAAHTAEKLIVDTSTLEIIDVVLRPKNIGEVRLEKNKTITYFTDNYNLNWLVSNENSWKNYNVSIRNFSNVKFCHRANGEIFTLTRYDMQFFVDINRYMYYISNNILKRYDGEEIINKANLYFVFMKRWVSGIYVEGNYKQGYFNHQNIVLENQFSIANNDNFVTY